jgi:heme-degrading monooxygenase HmoA
MSYMRVTRSRVDPSKVDEANKVLPDIIAAIKQLPGFQSIAVGGNRTTGEAIAVSIFDTEEHARWTANPQTDNASRLRAAGVQMDPPEFFEVTTS